MKLSPIYWWRRWREPWREVFHKAYARWRRDGMERRRRIFEGLGDKPVMLDFGGFEGNWAAEMHAAYGARVHVFEPHPSFAASIARRFDGNGDIVTHPLALGGADGELVLSDDGDASSAMRDGISAVRGLVRAATPYLDTLGLERVDVAKINIEGGEYDLLPELIESGWIGKIDRVQVQFHLFTPDEIRRRDAIRDGLSRTHFCEWEYAFVWEQWKRRV